MLKMNKEDYKEFSLWNMLNAIRALTMLLKMENVPEDVRIKFAKEIWRFTEVIEKDFSLKLATEKEMSDISELEELEELYNK